MLRTNRPRAYVVAGLAGGTGGGMCLDLAYLIRHELRQVGYFKPDVVGVLFVPPADKYTARSVALGNTFAALSELHHYQSRKARYQTVFDKSEAPVVDADPPFSRVSVLTLPKKPEAKAQLGSTEQAIHDQDVLVNAAVDDLRFALGAYDEDRRHLALHNAAREDDIDTAAVVEDGDGAPRWRVSSQSVAIVAGRLDRDDGGCRNGHALTGR